MFMCIIEHTRTVYTYTERGYSRALKQVRHEDENLLTSTPPQPKQSPQKRDIKNHCGVILSFNLFDELNSIIQKWYEKHKWYERSNPQLSNPQFDQHDYRLFNNFSHIYQETDNY